jgi:hypothetical protein
MNRAFDEPSVNEPAFDEPSVDEKLVDEKSVDELPLFQIFSIEWHGIINTARLMTRSSFGIYVAKLKPFFKFFTSS